MGKGAVEQNAEGASEARGSGGGWHGGGEGTLGVSSQDTDLCYW